MQTLALHEGQHKHVKALPLPRLAASTHDPAGVARQATLIRLASIVEAFCMDALIDAAETLAAPGASSTMQVIWDQASISATRTWRDQQMAYKNWLGIKPNWSFIDALADARNAVAHGLGKLTRQQLRREAAVRTSLASIGLQVSGRELQITEQALKRIARDCRHFIVDVDALVQARLKAP